MRLAVSGLRAAVDKHATVVTPSPLLAAVTEHQIATHHLANGIQSWRRTPVYGIDAWLSTCWQEARYHSGVPSLLSPSQEHLLWHDIIEQEHPHLFDSHAAARLASRAARVVAEYRIPPEGTLWEDHADALQFQRWMRTFRHKCRDAGWITRADLWRLVPSWMAQGLCGREPVLFAGFDRLTPALAAVREVLPASALLECTFDSGVHAVKAFPGLAAELEFAARAARAAFEHNPTQSIAVFVPDLASRRSLVERTFQAVFYPSRALTDTSPPRSVFHVYPPRALIEDPVVVNALLLLELARPRIGHAEAGAILRSPFIFGATLERTQRARADLDLRKRRDLDFSLRDLQAVSAKCPALTRIWSSVAPVLRGKPKYAELSSWSEFISDLLHACGWPGDTALSGHEQDAVEQWNQVLSSLAALGLLSGAATFDSALAHLRPLLSRPGIERGDWFSPVQILDGAQAVGLEFDLALITGLSDETWPPPLDLSPLLPLKLQRTHQVPGACAESARAERDRLTAALFHCAPNVLGTYSDRLSPAAAHFTGRIEAAPLLWNGKLPRQSYAPAALDELEDIFAPPCNVSQPARGGAAVIKSQSLCPFRAFAEFRLNARAPEDACFGFDARDRGGFLHKALQLVWDRLRTQDALRSMAEPALRAVIQDALIQAVRDDPSSPLHHLSTSAERERLEELILAWLHIERTRKQPFTIDTVEEECVYEVAGLRLSLRVDRIDRLNGGGVLLIDYKSGKQSREKLKCPRPFEPQLLVYAAASDRRVDGIFFGELKPREPRAVGFSREKHFDGASATIVRDWSGFLCESRAEIERLAKQFVAGYAAVDPLGGACEYCQIKPMCRIQESCEKEQDPD